MAGLALFVFGCFIGLSFPDLDQKFYWNPVIVHRSILTHNPFLPLLLWFVFRRSLEPAARLFLIGLSLATAVHLGFDLYPRDMYGFALVHVPFQGRTSATFSEVWLAAGMVISLGLATRLIRSMGDFVLSFFGLIVVYGVCAAQEPWASFWVLLWLVPVSFLAFVLSRPKDDPEDPGARLRRLMNSQ